MNNNTAATVTRDAFLSTTMAKSDQINAADLLGGPLVCQITDIVMTGSADQPVSIYVDSHPQPWKPSKTSRRVLAACWSDVEPSEWVGRYIVLFNDPNVMWAGKAEGGIRCSHLSHIDGPKTIMVNATRGKKSAQHVEPYYPANAPQPVAELPYYADENFSQNLTKWVALIDSGEKTPEQIIASIEKRARLTTGQKARIKASELAAPVVEQAPAPACEDDPFADDEAQEAAE
jgi:hypothetical protein